MNSKLRSSLYAWGGPGTVRLLKTKYFSPKIDRESFLRLYDQPVLSQVKKIFKTTDMFVSFSWGFSDQTEKEDYQFTATRLENFQKNHIKTYAYIQGLNLVYKEFPLQDLFCKDQSDRLLLYSKGRAFTCPNNPHAVDLIKKRIENALTYPFDNIFVDNILFGLPPLYIYANETSFFGCSCQYCQHSFRAIFGYNLPLGRKIGSTVIADYLSFRTSTIARVLQQLSSMVRSAGKGFGINLYDPFWHSAPYYFGYELSQIELYLDYLLIENHALKKETINNAHLADLREQTNKPLFVVSYRKGIGRESTYSQHDMNLIYTESQQLGYIPCYKATEYKTSGVWHAIRPSLYKRPWYVSFHKETISPSQVLRGASLSDSVISPVINSVYSYLSSRIPEHRILSYLFIESPIFTETLKKRRYFQ